MDSAKREMPHFYRALNSKKKPSKINNYQLGNFNIASSQGSDTDLNI